MFCRFELIEGTSNSGREIFKSLVLIAGYMGICDKKYTDYGTSVRSSRAKMKETNQTHFPYVK